MTARDQIRGWIEQGRSTGATYVIVVLDEFDSECYPVFVQRGQNVHEMKKQYDNVDMQQLKAIYWLGGDIEEQFSLLSCFTYSPEDQPQPQPSASS